MTIVDKIINSIKAVHGEDFPVYYHDDPTLNLMTQEMRFPCALFMLLTSGGAKQEAGQLKERLSAAVFFVEPSKFDFDAVKNERIIDRCKHRAFTWLAGISSDRYITAELTSTSRVYDKYDDILTGFGVFVDVTELQGVTGCWRCPSDFGNDFNDDFGGWCPDYNEDYNMDYNSIH